MVATLLSHSWKKLRRSVSFTKELATSIFLGLFSLMMVGYTVALGVALEKIITNGLKQTDSFQFLNGLLIYYFGFEFMMRYFMQNMPVMDVQPYLHLPMKRSGIVHYLLIKSLVHVLNGFVLLLFAPFAFTVVAQQFGSLAGWSWLITLCLFSLCIHYIVLLFKKGFDDTLAGFLVLVGVLGLLAASDYYGWFSFSELTAPLFASAVHTVYFPAAILLVLLILYFLNFQFFLKSMYSDELVFHKTNAQSNNQDFAFLQNFGSIGEWINLEVKLILRNKRPRTILYFSAFFLLYGLIFYTQDTYTEKMPSFLLFVGIFITGIFMMNYGQILFSWQGGHFDFTLTRPISMRQVVESKYWLLSSVTVLCFLLSIPYVYFGWRIIFIHAAMTLFNLGINIFIVMNIAMWEPKKIDLKKGGSFNYEGVGAAQWVMSIPIMAAPYVIYLPFNFAGHPNLGILAVGAVGLLGIILRPYLLKLTTRRLEERRYTMAAGFRKD